MLRMLLRWTLLLAILAVTPFFGSESFAAKRLALVIGNNDYKEVPKLEKAVGDATAIGEKLAELSILTAAN
jgi:hypothetical protein